MKKILYICLTISCFLFIGEVNALSIDNISLLVNEGSDALSCNNSSVLKIIYLIKTGITLIQIVAPIILIIMLMIDGLSSMTSEEGMNKKFIGKSTKKILAAVIIFITPAIINLLLSFLGQAGFEEANCWNDATKEGIEAAEENEEINLDQDNNENENENQNIPNQDDRSGSQGSF